MMTLKSLYDEGERQIFYALCHCEENGYVNVKWFRDMNEALWEGAIRYDLERYGIIRYNAVNGRWKVCKMFNDPFELYLIVSQYDTTPPMKPIIYGNVLLPMKDAMNNLFDGWYGPPQF